MSNTYPEPYRSAMKDTLVDPSTCYNRECVSYCAWKIAEATGRWMPRTGDMNAINWQYRLPENGYRRVNEPREGGCYVGVLPEGQYGHVVWYEGGRRISEYNYNYNGQYNERTINLATYLWYEIVPAPSTPSPTPTPPAENSGAFSVGDKVEFVHPIDINGTPLNVSGIYDVMEVSRGSLVVGRGGVVTARVAESSVRKVSATPIAPTQPSDKPVEGDRVTTSATYDAQNNLQLNLAIINDGQSVFSRVNSKGNAVLTKDNVIRAAVAVDSLHKV